VNYNAEALIIVMRPPEATVQILMNAVNGVGSIPGVGSMSPRLIPSELTGMALCNFYDARGVPTRSNVPVYLPGNTAIGFRKVRIKAHRVSRLRQSFRQWDKRRRFRVLR
jgi:hypothetical protein